MDNCCLSRSFQIDHFAVQRNWKYVATKNLFCESHDEKLRDRQSLSRAESNAYYFRVHFWAQIKDFFTGFKVRRKETETFFFCERLERLLCNSQSNALHNFLARLRMWAQSNWKKSLRRYVISSLFFFFFFGFCVWRQRVHEYASECARVRAFHAVVDWETISNSFVVYCIKHSSFEHFLVDIFPRLFRFICARETKNKTVFVE